MAMCGSHPATAFHAEANLGENQRAEEMARQANHALAKAERHDRLIFNSISDAVFVMKLDRDGMLGEFIDFNDSACRYLGYSREQLQQMRIHDLTAPECLPRMPVPTRANPAERHLIWEGIHLASDGRRIPVEVSINVVDLDGAPAVIATVRDITDRRDAEIRYRGLFEGTLEGVYRISVQGKLLAVNPALVSMLGYASAEEAISLIDDSSHRLWLDPSECSRLTELVEARDVVREYECQFRRKDGSLIWVLLNSRKVCGEDGRTLYYEGFLQDISARKQAEDALRNSAERRRTILHTAMDGFSVTDAEGRLLEVNETYCRMSGYSEEELLAMRTASLEGKLRRRGRCSGYRPDWKKAYVRLRAGQKMPEYAEV